MRIRLAPIKQLATMAGVVAKDGVGVVESDLGLIERAALVLDGDRIVYVGPADAAPGALGDEQTIDAGELVALPGLIDPHTHPCWAGSRWNEFAMRAAGATYLDISRAGGGIRASIAATRAASEGELAVTTAARLRRMLALGVTTVEAKSGYALEVEGELRLLRAIRQAGAAAGVTVFATFLAAHAIPPEFEGRGDAYVDLIVNEMLPRVAAERLAEFCDVFVEDGFFTPAQGRRILRAAAQHGLKPRLHADEFISLGGAQLAAELAAASADHLMAIDDDGVRALAAAGVTAVLLPATTLFLGQTNFAPARRLLDAGGRVAVATDFNPGSCHTENLQLALTLACTHLQMTVPEALAAVTYNAARSLLAHNQRGALLPGRRADVALFAAPDVRAIPYHLAMNDVRLAVAGGQVYGVNEATARPASRTAAPSSTRA